MVLQHSPMHFSSTLIKAVKTINSTPPMVPLFLVGFGFGGFCLGLFLVKKCVWLVKWQQLFLL